MLTWPWQASRLNPGRRRGHGLYVSVRQKITRGRNASQLTQDYTRDAVSALLIDRYLRHVEFVGCLLGIQWGNSLGRSGCSIGRIVKRQSRQSTSAQNTKLAQRKATRTALNWLEVS